MNVCITAEKVAILSNTYNWNILKTFEIALSKIDEL